jgi:hypothetical protein
MANIIPKRDRLAKFNSFDEYSSSLLKRDQERATVDRQVAEIQARLKQQAEQSEKPDAA